MQSNRAVTVEDVLAIARRNAWTLVAFAAAASTLLLIGLVVSRRDWLAIVLLGALGCQTTATLWYRARAREWSERYAATREDAAR